MFIYEITVRRENKTSNQRNSLNSQLEFLNQRIRGRAVLEFRRSIVITDGHARSACSSVKTVVINLKTYFRLFRMSMSQMFNCLFNTLLTYIVFDSLHFLMCLFKYERISHYFMILLLGPEGDDLKM